jgi:hypothetical protein
VHRILPCKITKHGQVLPDKAFFNSYAKPQYVICSRVKHTAITSSPKAPNPFAHSGISFLFELRLPSRCSGRPSHAITTTSYHGISYQALQERENARATTPMLKGNALKHGENVCTNDRIGVSRAQNGLEKDHCSLSRTQLLKWRL